MHNKDSTGDRESTSSDSQDTQVVNADLPVGDEDKWNFDDDIAYRKFYEYSIGHGFDSRDVLQLDGILSGKTLTDLWKQSKTGGFVSLISTIPIQAGASTTKVPNARLSMQVSRSREASTDDECSESVDDDEQDGQKPQQSLSLKEKIKQSKEKREQKKLQRKSLRSSVGRQENSDVDESSYQTSASEDEDTETRSLRKRFSGFFKKASESETEETGGRSLRRTISGIFRRSESDADDSESGTRRKKFSNRSAKNSESDVEDDQLKTPRKSMLMLSPRTSSRKIEDKKQVVIAPKEPIYFEELLNKTSAHEFAVIEMLADLPGGPDDFRFKPMEVRCGLQYEIQRIGTCPEFNPSCVNGKLQSKNIIFTLWIMEEEIDPHARLKLLKLDHTFLKKFFSSLQMFGVSTRSGLANDMETRRLAMRKALIKKSNITLRELQEILHPEAFLHYKKNREHYVDIMQCYNALSIELVKQNRPIINPSMQCANYDKVFNGNKAIGKARKALLAGDIQPVYALTSDSGIENVINGIKYQVRGNDQNLKTKIAACLDSRAFKPKRLDLTHFDLTEKELIYFLGGRDQHGENLTYLNLSNCANVSEVIYISASLNSNLTTLVLRNTPIKGVDITLEYITTFDLSGTKVKDNIFVQLSEKCHNLQSLKLCNNAITKITARLPKLTHLDLSGCEVDESIFEQVFEFCPQIRSLRLASNKIKVININEVRLCLVELDVSGCKNLVSIESQPIRNPRKFVEKKGQQKEKFAFRVLRANNCALLERIDLDLAAAEDLTALYANYNENLVSVSLAEGLSLPALTILEVISYKLKILKVNPMRMMRIKLISSNIGSTLNAVIDRCLLRQAVYSGDSNALQVLSIKSDFIPRAINEYGESVFHNIRARDFDGRNMKLSGASFVGTDFRRARLAGADLTDVDLNRTNFEDVDLEQSPSLTDHEAVVTALAYSKEGDLFASADINGNMVLRHKEKVLQTMNLGRAISSLAFSPNGKKLVIAGACSDKKANDNKDSKELTESLKQINPSNKMIVDQNDRYILLHYDINLQNAEPLRLASCHYAHALEIKIVAYTEDGKYLLTASEDKKIKIFNTTTGKINQVIQSVDKGFICSMAVHPNNSLLAVGYSDGTIIVWNFLQARIIEILAEPNKAHEMPVWNRQVTGVPVNCLIWSQGKKFGGHYLLSGSDDKTIKIWTKSKPGLEAKIVSEPKWVCVRTLQRKATELAGFDIPGHESLVSCIAMDRDCKYVFSADDRGTKGRHALMVWNFNTGDLLRLYGHDEGIKAIVINPIPLEGKGLLTWEVRTGCVDSKVRRFNFQDDGYVYQLGRPHLNRVLNAARVKTEGIRGASADTVAVLVEAGAIAPKRGLKLSASAAGSPQAIFAQKPAATGGLTRKESDESDFSDDEPVVLDSAKLPT